MTRTDKCAICVVLNWLIEEFPQFLQIRAPNRIPIRKTSNSHPNEHDLAYREGENANQKSEERINKEATVDERNLHCDSCGREGNENNDGTSVDQLPSIKAQKVL